MAAIGLADGTRVGVIGGGPSGAAFASALLASARAFGRRLDLVIYDGGAEGALAPPALLDVDTRYRLASLGAPVPLRNGALELRGILVQGRESSTLLEPPTGGLWVLDGVAGAPGSRIVKQVLLAAAGLRGASMRPWRVDTATQVGQRWVVRAQGSAESFDLVVGAFGASSGLASSWLDGRLFARRRLGAHARIAGAGRDDLLRLFVAPAPGIDLIWVIPCPSGESYALAAGDDVGVADLAGALAGLSRDGALPDPLEIRRVERVALTAGAASRVARGSAMALGAAAYGGALQPGLLASLVGAMRASNAVLEAGASPALASRLARSQAEILLHARQQERALAWARRAGPRSPAAFADVVRRGLTPRPGGLPLLTLPALDPGELISALRAEAILGWLARLLPRTKAPEPAPSAPALVYVVDDDADARAALVELLERRGHRVRAFGDEMALLGSAARERPRAILLDVVLRWVDGLSLCRALRSHPATARARIVSMSGLNRRSDRAAALASGADAFLSKPIDPGELDRALDGALRGARERSAVAQSANG